VSLSYKKLQKNELEKLHVRLFMAAGLCIRRVVMLRSEQLLPNFLEKLEDELRELIRKHTENTRPTDMRGSATKRKTGSGRPKTREQLRTLNTSQTTNVCKKYKADISSSDEHSVN